LLDRPPTRPLAAAIAVVAALLLAAGCGDSGSTGGASSQATSVQRPPQARASSVGGGGHPSPCPSAALAVRNGRSGAAAGTIYMAVEVTNRSNRTCTLAGFPRVTAIDAGGHQLGAPARRDPLLKLVEAPGAPSSRGVAALSPHHTAAFQMRFVEAADYPASACNARTATHLRIALPGAAGSHDVPLRFERCVTKHGGSAWGVGRIE
jgi:hypothetical protein